MKKTVLGDYVFYTLNNAEDSWRTYILEERDMKVIIDVGNDPLSVFLVFKDCINCEIVITGRTNHMEIMELTNSSLVIHDEEGMPIFKRCDMSLISTKVKKQSMIDCFGIPRIIDARKVSLDTDLDDGLFNSAVGNCKSLTLLEYHNKPIINHELLKLKITRGSGGPTVDLTNVHCTGLLCLVLEQFNGSHFSNFEKFERLKTLSLTNSKLTNDRLLLPKSLTSLTICRCVVECEELTIEAEKLAEVYFNDTPLKALNFEYSSELVELNLSDCELKRLPLLKPLDNSAIYKKIMEYSTNLCNGSLAVYDFSILICDEMEKMKKREIITRGNPLEYPDGRLFDHEKDNLYEYISIWTRHLYQLKQKSAMN